MKDNNKPFIKKPKPAAVDIPLPKIDFTPIPTVASTMSPEDRAMEQRFNQMMEQDEKKKLEIKIVVLQAYWEVEVSYMINMRLNTS